MKTTTVGLGDLVQDTVTGFKGIAVGHTTWLFGCARVTVQPQGVQKDGKTFESQAFDEPQLKILKRAKKADIPENHTTGGPRADVKQVRYKS